MEKICTNCNQTKPLKEFYKQSDRKNGSSYCKSCFNKYCQERWIQRKKDAIIMKGSKCVDCSLEFDGNNYVVFDFHHRDPYSKEATWQKMRLWSSKKREDELEKCDLLCSNCHRLRHHNMVPPA